MRTYGFALLCCLILSPHALQARDAYGNNTSWTNSDTTIDRIQVERRAAERQPQWYNQFSTPLPTQSWRQQEAARLEALRNRDRDEDWDYGGSRWSYDPTPSAPPQPLTYEQSLENDVLHRSDREAQERLAFYYVSIGKPLPAVRHLEMVVFLKKSDRAGEAAYELYRIASAGGAAPDKVRARRYLHEAVQLGYPAALYAQGMAWITGDEKNGISPDVAKGEAMLLRVVGSNEPWTPNRLAGEFLFKQYYLGGFIPANADKAIEVTRLMRGITTIPKPVDNWQEDRFTELLIAQGWEKNHAEIIESMERNHGSLFYAEKAERIARIYLGIDEDVAAYVKPDQKKALEALRNLSRLAPDRALPYLLQAEFARDLSFVTEMLVKASEKEPANPKWIRLLASRYGRPASESDRTNALEDYLASLDSPDAKPAPLLGAARFFLIGGDNVPADPARAVRAYKRLTAGHAVNYSTEAYAANLELAQMYLLGDGILKDNYEGVMLLEHAIVTEIAASYPHRALLASIYRRNDRVERDLRRAREIASLAAFQHHAEAQFQYAAILREWDDLRDAISEVDKQEAFELLKESAATGLSDARLLLADYYREGFGTEVNTDLALAIYEEGAAQNIGAAYTGLATLFADARSPLHNPARAFEAAQAASDFQDERGDYLLGDCYLNGLGTERDPLRAFSLFTNAAQAGIWDAALKASKLLAAGDTGLTADPAMASERLEAATRLQSTPEQKFIMGTLLLGRDFIPRNVDRARTWLTLAAGLGHEDARQLLDKEFPATDS